MKRIVITLSFVFAAVSSNAQTILFEENFTSGIPDTWALVDNDGLIPDADVAEFTEAWIPFQTVSDTCAASTSFYSPTGEASDYLITPRMSIGNFSKIVWSGRSFDASYPDGYTVLISNTDSLIGSFTDTLFTTLAENSTWQRRSFDLDVKGYNNEDVFIAFKNNTNNGYILLIDDIVLLGAETASIPSEETIIVKFGPNPTTDYIQFQVEGLQSIEVYSFDGKKLTETTSQMLNTSSLASGHYIAVVNTIDGSEKVKFIKQ